MQVKVTDLLRFTSNLVAYWVMLGAACIGGFSLGMVTWCPPQYAHIFLKLSAVGFAQATIMYIVFWFFQKANNKSGEL